MPGAWYRGLSKPGWTPPRLGLSRDMDGALPVLGPWRRRASHRWRVTTTGWPSGLCRSPSTRSGRRSFSGSTRIRAGFVIMLFFYGSRWQARWSTFFALDWIAGALFVPYLVLGHDRGRTQRQRLDAATRTRRRSRRVSGVGALPTDPFTRAISLARASSGSFPGSFNYIGKQDSESIRNYRVKDCRNALQRSPAPQGASVLR